MQPFVALVSLVLSVRAGGTTTTESLDDRSFIIHLPSTYDDTDVTLPLVLNLHGFGKSAEQQMVTSNMNDHADQNGYIAVYPQGKSTGSFWSMNLTYWNDLAVGGSPGPLGPTCSGQAPALDDTGDAFLSAVKLAVPSECRDVFGCNLIDCTTDDIGFIEDLLDEVEANYRVDSSRVYVTGFSNGNP